MVIDVLEENIIVSHEVNYDKKEMEAFFLNLIEEYGEKKEEYLKNISHPELVREKYAKIIDQTSDSKALNKKLIGSPRSYNIMIKGILYPSIYHTLRKILSSKRFDFSQLKEYLDGNPKSAMELQFPNVKNYLINYDDDEKVQEQVKCLPDFLKLLNLKEVFRGDISKIDEAVNLLIEFDALEKEDLLKHRERIKIAKMNTEVIETINKTKDLDTQYQKS